MTIGIYLFTNKINNKKYIGQSVNIEKRYAEHRTRPFNQSSTMYNGKFYRAIRKYGIDNFTFEIIDSNENYTKEELNFLEKKYIQQYDTYINGYNMSYGGDSIYVPQKVNFEDRVKIQNLIKNTDITFSQIAKEFKIEPSLISQVNQGIIWVIVGEKYPLRDRVNIKQNKGERNPSARLTDNEVMKMRERYVTETMPDIYKDYSYMSFQEVKKVIYGSQFKHLPVYKKREKQWYLNGTSIDYPCLKE